MLQFYYWGSVECGHSSFFSTAKQMYKDGGLRPFFVGSTATVMRDVVFGAAFYVLRKITWLKSSEQGSGKATHSSIFLSNAVAAFVATLLSSPFNYVRNIDYATPPGVDPGSPLRVLRDLWSEAKAVRGPGDVFSNASTVAEVGVASRAYHRFMFIQQRLRIGWGTARVAVGMAFGSVVYEYLDALSTVALNRR
jgi:hypothetical protein